MFDQRSIIDYFIVSDRRIVEDVKVIPGVSMDSDHRLLLADLKIQAEKVQVKEKWSTIKVDSLKDQDKRLNYVGKVNEKILEMNGDETMEHIGSVVKETARETLGIKWMGGVRKKHTPWWNEQVKNAVRQKMVALRRWLKNRSVQSRAVYVEARNEAERVKRRAKEEVAEKLAKELMDDMKESKKKIFRLARTYRGAKSRVCNIKDKNGEPLVSPEEKNKRWIEYFDELVNVEVQSEEEGEREEEEERNLEGE